MRKIFATFALASLIATPALAAPCRNAAGKFVTCPQAKAAPVRKAPCKDVRGKFVKCAK